MTQTARLFRVRNNKTNNWWEGMASDDAHACRLAGWRYEDCYIRLKSTNGGWKKYKKEGDK
jgi:hypothetical protein